MPTHPTKVKLGADSHVVNRDSRVGSRTSTSLAKFSFFLTVKFSFILTVNLEAPQLLLFGWFVLLHPFVQMISQVFHHRRVILGNIMLLVGIMIQVKERLLA